MAKYTKGTGPVDIGAWTAPMKSRRFFSGGSVPSTEEVERDRGERASRESLLRDRFKDIDKQGKDTPNVYESEQNRSKSIIKEPLKTYSDFPDDPPEQPYEERA